MSRLINARLLPGIFFLALLSACASTPQTQLLQSTSSELPRQQLLNTVKFFPQEKYQCGPASLASMLNYQGIQATPAGLKDKVYVPELHGSLQLEMIATARAQGLL